MKKRLSFTLAAISTPVFALSTVACGQVIQTPRAIRLVNFFGEQSNVQNVESFWKTVALAKIYNITLDKNDLTFTELNKAFADAFANKQSQLYKDSYNAFRFYAQDKINKDSFYFTNKVNEWNKEGILTENDINLVTPKLVPSEEDFVKIWNADQTGIRSEINNMLLVKSYFAIGSNAKNGTEAKAKVLDELKKIYKQESNQDFKYASDNEYGKYDLDHYFLNRYASSQKYIQLWKRNDTKAFAGDEIFISGTQTITSPETFNNFFEKQAEKDNKIQDWQIITTNGEVEKQLDGFAGFVKDDGKYGLQWNFDDLKNSTNDNLLYGVFDPNNGTRLVNFQTLSSGEGTAVNPYQIKDGSNSEVIVAYINQITPIGGVNEVTLPKAKYVDVKAEELKADQKESVKVLSFNNTIYKNSLDTLSYLYFLQDKSLLEKAINAYASLGIKIEISEEIKPLFDLLKDKVWIQKPESYKEDKAKDPENVTPSTTRGK